MRNDNLNFFYSAFVQILSCFFALTYDIISHLGLKTLPEFQLKQRPEIVNLKVGTNDNGSACGRWLSIGI
jgi:hypothetical protein